MNADAESYEAVDGIVLGKAAVRKLKEDKWNVLLRRIDDVTTAARADEVKGSGDPMYLKVIELRYELAVAELDVHIETMRREEEGR